MRTRTGRYGVVLLVAAGIAAWAYGQSRPAAPTAAARETLTSLAWLTGSWSGPFQGGTWESVYTSSTGGVLLSASKEMDANGRVKMIEFEHFDARGDEVFVTPYPFGRKSVSFRLVEHDGSAKRVVFSNPDHDFPKTLTYHRTSDTELRITVAGAPEDKARSFELVLKKN